MLTSGALTVYTMVTGVNAYSGDLCYFRIYISSVFFDQNA